MPFVLDSSVAIAWFMPDGRNPEADELSRRLTHDIALVPAIWSLEVGNVLLASVRRGRVSREQLLAIAGGLQELPIRPDGDSAQAGLGAVLGLSESCGLTTYDAAYLELAHRHQLPLATLDERLRRGAEGLGVALLPG